MKFIGNILWLIFGGFVTAMGYILASLLLMITIIGIPFGLQTLKLGIFAFWPFGKDVSPSSNADGCLSLFMNLLWILFGGFWISISHLVFGVLLCITIIGIPFGMQHFKMAALALTPFGREIH